MLRPSVLAFVVKEFKEIVPPTIFFAAGFNLILLTTNLILEDYEVQFSSFLLATTGALIVGKAVLVANALPFFRLFDTAPLIRPVLFKSGIYFAVVCAVRFLEKLIEFLVHGGALRELPDYVATHFTWSRFFAIQIWILVLFLIYTFINELNTLFGDGELARILFTWRSTELKQTRRQRIRILTKLSRLADAHTTDELADPATAAHTQMIDLIRSLAKNGTSRASPAPVQR
jgi:hypothetical protein